MNKIYQTKQTVQTNKVMKAFFVRYLMILALLLGVAGTAGATDYIITYTSGGTTYYIGMDGTNLVAKTVPDATCVWTAINRNNNTENSLSTTSGNNYRRRLRNKNNTSYFLSASVTQSGSWYNYTYTWNITASTTGSSYWYGAEGASLYHTDNDYSQGNGYLHNSGSSVTISTSTSNSFIPYAVTVTTVSTSTGVAINSGADILTATGNSNYTTQSAAYQTSYTNYKYNNNANHYFDANGNSFTGTPAAATISYSWSLTPNDYATVSGTTTTGTVNVSSLPETDITLTLTVTATAAGGTPAAPANTIFTDSKQITIQGTKPTAPIISVSGTTVTLSTTAVGSTTIRYTLDGTDPTASTGTVYSGAIDLSGSSTSPVTIKAVTVRNGNASDISTEIVTLTLPTPTITINGEAKTATITSSVAGATIYYTTDGTTPTTSSTQFTTTLTGLAYMTNVKAIAVKDGWNNSPVASGIVTIPSGVGGGVVTLFDYEPHSWSYYSDPDCPVRSLSPADVTITYYGDGVMMTNNNNYTAGTTDTILPGNANYQVGAHVNVGGEDENTFVYYKTLERGDATQTAWTFSSGSQTSAASRCPYTTIPNPFQVRPRYGARTVDANDFTGWRGFQCWRLKSVTGGAVYSAASGGDSLTVGAVINAETKIYFAPDNEYGMKVELEAVWARAYVKKANQANENPVGTNNVGYERNFCVPTTGAGYTLYTGTGKRITNANHIPVTISCYYPDGSAPDNTNNSISNTATSLTGDTKFENIPINLTSNTLTLANYDLIIGRGCNTSTINSLQGISGTFNGDLDYTMRIETGTVSLLAYVAEINCTVSGRVQVKAIMGSDYDRAKKNNSLLSVSNNNNLFFTRDVAFSNDSNKDQKVFDLVVKSGEYQKSYWTNTGDETGFTYTHSMYCGANFGSSSNNAHYPGLRCVTIEGGALGNINGGRGTRVDGNNNNPAATTTGTDANNLGFDLRIKSDAIINGCVFGGAANTSAWGSKRIVVTGGKIRSWIAGGANGTNTTSGDSRTRGGSYIYVGGNAIVGGPDALRRNGTYGGQIFGAGRGNTNQAASMDSSFVVIADNAQILSKAGESSGNVYGGGNIGYIVHKTNIYILGGTIEGSVFGGAFSNALAIPNTNITMRGGLVKGGIYGGSNSSGTISENVNIHIDGGQVGVDVEHPANVHGGGLGQPTRVSQNVEITLGSSCTATEGVTVYGDVYGGSALGYVNGTAATNTYHTYVTLNKGTIYGSLYGGGLGEPGTAANVYGPVAVKVYGGSVRKTDANGANGSGAVYGCNNVNGAPQRAVSVDIYGTDPQPSEDEYALFAVYGGGNQADYSYGTPTVTVHNCDNSIEYVYGGGNAAHITNGNTDVTIYGGNKIGNVFGGGNGTVTAANVSGNTNVKIYGGTIGKVFGGSNSRGTIGGTISVTAEAQTEAGNDPCSGNAYQRCPIQVGELYGGGNMAASNVGAIGIGCMNDGDMIDYVYGGSNDADITGNVNLIMTGGRVGNLFGGNNTGHSISGSITVTVNWNNSCSNNYLGNVFGGGNLATIGSVGSLKAPTVRIYNGTVSGNVYGGGKGLDSDHSKGQVTGNPIVTIGDNDNNHQAIITGDVYGGGDAGNVAGTPQVTVINKCNTRIGYVYGGGNAADVNGTNVAINGGTIVYDVFGGGHGDKASLGTGHSDKVANVNGNAVVSITGATIGRVFAGSNINGTITGNNCSLTINKANDANCAMKIGEVYGGGNMANGNATSISVGCTGGWTTTGTKNHTNANLTDNRIGYELEGIGVVYGGANQADIGTNGNHSDITLNINSGMVNQVFGGNNTSGDIYGTIAVNINKNAQTCGWYVGDVFGGGNLATYSGSPTVTLTAGTVSGNIYGGGNEAGTGGSTVNINGGAMTAGKGIYGGCNTSGTVTGNIAVNINGGTLGTSGNGNALYGIFGGGYGQSTKTEGNVTVTIGSLDGTKVPTIYGDIYGGSALGNVNDDNNDITTVNFYNGTLHGNIFGGGLGDKASLGGGHTDVAAKVNGQVYVNVGAESQTDANCHINLKDASVYGCNNTNGSPQDTVVVHIWKTDHMATDTAEFVGAEPGTPTYAITNVFGGGKNADYLPENGLASSTKRATVHVHGCGNTIQNVYAGGDAAAATGVGLTIDGGRFDLVFGGGNGTVVAANINDGGTNTVINAGIINKLFGGSNTQGTISGEMRTVINKTGSCTENIKEFFAGGNLAPITADLNTIINCNTVFGDIYGGANQANITGDVTLTINGGTIENVYAGSKGVVGTPANITGNVTLNLYGGDIGNAFGGSNINGNITGLIRVNLDWKDNGCSQKQIDNIYGASNLAQYNPGDDCRANGVYTPLVTLTNGTVGRTTARAGHVAFIPDSIHSLGRVFGAGKGKVSEAAAGKVTANPKVWLNAANTTDVIVFSSVYGGGEVASVDGSTLVQLTNGHVGCDEKNLAHDNGFVFGGGMGDTEDPDLAYIRDSAKVVMTGGYVHNTIFGGGQIASIGTYNRASSADPTNDIIVGEPTSLKIANTGRSIVDISGGQVGPVNVTMAADLGYVFGSSMGFYTQPGVTYTDPKVNSIAEGRLNAKFGYVDSAEVRVSGTVLIVGAVWGGSENGQVLHSCGVKVSGGQIGIGDGKSGPYSKSLWTRAKNAVKEHKADSIKAVALLMTECNHWPYASPYLPYDPYANDDAWSDGVATTSTTDGDGHTYFGNVFGGGSGYYPYRVHRVVNPAQDSNVWYAFQGRVRGNTRVEITDSAHVLTSIYGGCEYADVMGDATVVMTGGTLGIPRTVEATLNHPVTCYLFGAGKGDQRTIFNTRTHVRNTFVTIGGDAMIYGSVFGGGEDGHVDSSATVTITGNAIVGTWGTSYYDGNIFGGGRGFGGTSLTAGSMGANATVNINGDCKILGNVYGGGRLASVGLHIVDSVDVTYYGHLKGDASGDAASLKATHGNIVINISGGTIGSGIEFAPATFAPDRAYVVNDIVFHDNNIWRFKAAHPAGAWDTSHVKVIDHTTGGNVFGGSMGRLTKINGTKNHLWPGLAKVRRTNVNITDTARIYGNVYGGGELGYVMDSTNITINGNAEIGYAIGSMPDIRYTGSIYGGGYGSDDITAHVNDTLSLNGISVTAAMHSGRVYGNTRVTMNNGQVWGNIYGGGEMASVGRRWINMALNGNADNFIPYNGNSNSSYTARNWNNTADTTYTTFAWNSHIGNTRVIINGGTVGNNNAEERVIGTHRQAGYVAGGTGGVFGGGKGHPGMIGDDFHYTRMAYVDSTNVIIKGGNITGAVFGGGENGHVRFGTLINMTDGTVGIPLDPIEYETDEYGYSPQPLYVGNLYGGGRGVDHTLHDHLGAAAGQVYGGTKVEISGGRIYHNVYGGGSLASVGRPISIDDSNLLDGTGHAIVTIKGNAVIGDPAAKGLNSGRVFGSGRGVAGQLYAHRAYVRKTTVTIGEDSPSQTCHVYGDVFGSGENGHVQDYTHVYIKNGCMIGELWNNLNRQSDQEFVGNVYGGGRGVDLASGQISRTAGLVPYHRHWRPNLPQHLWRRLAGKRGRHSRA